MMTDVVWKGMVVGGYLDSQKVTVMESVSSIVPKMSPGRYWRDG